MNTIEYWSRFTQAPKLVESAHADWIGHDFFCGFGGFSLSAYWVQGIQLAVINAVNHNPLCIEVHQRNHPHTQHHCADMLNPKQFEPGYLPKADFALMSPECKYHSGTTGVKALTDWVEQEIERQLSLFEDDKVTLAERNRRWQAMSEQERAKALWQAERSRLTMGQVVRIAEYHRYKFLIVENVVEVHKWRHFGEWYSEIEALGYEIEPLCLNSMFFGAPQSRDRVYFFCYQKGLPKPDLNWCPLSYCLVCQADVDAVQIWKRRGQRYGKYGAQYVYNCPVCGARAYPYVRGANNIIDWSLPMPTVGSRKDPLFCRRHRVRALQPKTRERIGAGLKMLAQRTVLDTAYSQAGVSGEVRNDEMPISTQTSRATLAVTQTPGRFISMLRSGRPRNQETEEPLATFTGINNCALVEVERSSPWSELSRGQGIGQAESQTVDTGMIVIRGNHPQHSGLEQPISTLTSVNHHAVIMSYYSRKDACRDVEQPVATITPEPRHALLQSPEQGKAGYPSNQPHILTYHGQAGWHPIGLPITTQTTRERHALVLPDGRTLDLDDPVQLEAAIDACRFRMLSWQEARLGMAFPESYKMSQNKRNNFFGLGQAVTPCAIPWMIERAVQAWGEG